MDLLNHLMRYANVSDGKGRKLESSHRLLELENIEYFQANFANVSRAETPQPGKTAELHMGFDGTLPEIS